MKLFVIFLLLSFPVLAKESLTLKYPETLPRPNAQTYYEITGNNPTNAPQIVIIKMTDVKGAAYHNRVNEERWVLPGNFRLLVQPSALQTPANRFLNLDHLLETKVFSNQPLNFHELHTFDRKLDLGPYAFDFGPDQSPVFKGFTHLSPGSPFITAGKTSAFIRKGTDSLIRDGIKGIERFELPIPNGDWMIHLWTEDIGEWETLPALYERRLRINGKDISLIRQNHSQWVQNRYLQGQSSSGQTPWENFGKRRGGYIQVPITITTKTFRLDLAGSNAQATTITGLLLEPLGNALWNDVQSLRKEWFELRWPYLEPAVQQEHSPKKIIAFAGETLFIPSEGKKVPTSSIVKIKKYSQLPNFHRSTPNSGLLVKSFQRLSPIPPVDNPSYLKITIPTSTQAGVYDLGDWALHVISDQKPTIKHSVGIYLEPPPNLKQADEINMQVWCDLDYLRSLGLTAVAPPFSNKITEDFKRASSFGFKDILAYTPMKRSKESVRAALKTGEINSLIFSIADEPSNPAQAQNIELLSSFLQNETPFAKRAGHLNNPKDKKYLKYIDLALVNSGFGVDKSHISALKSQGKVPWFYNMENVRLAAGFYIWRAQALGYLQWHGRMPTADPYDPTDGREDDVQMLYPSKTVCSSDFEIDLSLVNMVNGLSDLRWLTWLEQQAQESKRAKNLLKTISFLIPDNWKAAQSRPQAHWENLKQQIQDLALDLQK